ncbi:MAG: hypothetical protein ACYC5O_19760 [Anaerolineae bacterium]
MDLRDRALRALEHSRAEDDYERRRWFEEQKETAIGPFIDKFGVAPDGVTLGERYSLIIEHDGLHFSFVRHSREIHLLRTCPYCGEEVASPDVRDLVHLGHLLDDFAGFGHTCGAQGEPSLRLALHRLVDLWVDQVDPDVDAAEQRRRVERAIATALPFGLPPRNLRRAS